MNELLAKQDGNNVANVSTRLHWSSSEQYYVTTMSNQSYLYTVSRDGRCTGVSLHLPSLETVYT